jgi:hypothetical protein
MLRALGHYVTRTGAWVSDMHGIPNLASNPPGQSFHAPTTKLSNMILLDPVNEPQGFSSVDVGGTPVRVLMVIPLTSAEAQWKRDVGSRASIFFVLGDKEHYDHIRIGYVIEPARPCCVEDLHCDDEIAAHLAQQQQDGEEEDNGGGGGGGGSHEEENNGSSAKAGDNAKAADTGGGSGDEAA